MASPPSRNSSIPEDSARREVDRYIVFPGQACAYYMGMVRMLELRDRARRDLGTDFDPRGFHDAILRNGSVPLSVLDELISDWIEKARAI